MSLKHWWQLNGSLVDCIGGNNLVASSGFSSNDSGKIGRCYFASTTSAYAETATEIYRNGDLSLCFWFKLTAYSTSPTGLVTLHDYTDTSNMGINLVGDKLTMSIGYTDGGREWNGKNSTTVISLNKWYHGALTFNKQENKVALYVNGVKEVSATLSKEVKFQPKKLSVNRWSVCYASYMSTGYYNDIRFYDHTLSTKEVKEIAKANILHYNLNNRVNTAVRDSSGFKNHAQEISGCAPTHAVSDSGMGSGCYLFKNNAKQSNGLYQHIKSNSTVYIPEQGTLSYYIKYDTTNYAENGDNKYAVGYANFCSMNNSNALGMIYYYDASNYTTTTSSRDLRDGKWHMHTISWDKGTKAYKNYLDGVLIQSATVTNFQHAGTYRDFIVGSAWSTNYGGHSGFLDDVRVYATVLSDTDVAELYQVKGSVSKNGKLFVNEIAELGIETKTAYDATWARIFYHNNKSGTVLFSSNKEEFLYCNTADKKSNLWALDQFKNKDGKLELLLEYDGITGYNRWKQSSNFTKDAIAGYEAVQISWTSQGWGGLAPSADSGTWVDGSPTTSTSSWWYAIGCKSKHETGIPGPGSAVTGAVSLWARIDNLQTNRIDKRGVLYTNEIVEVDNCSMKTKTELNANWVRIFYHNVQAGTVLFSSNKQEFLKCSTADKQSDLWALEQFRGKDGKFELMLQYQNTTGYNRWKQSSNFTKEAIAGYEAVTVSWTANYWGGLEYNGTSSTWVDGSVNHGNWFYAIGCRSNYNSGMPGPNGVEAGWVEIWVRCDDVNLFRIIKNGKCKATEFIEI